MKYEYKRSFSYQGKRYWVYANTLEELYEKKALKKNNGNEELLALYAMFLMRENLGWNIYQ